MIQVLSFLKDTVKYTNLDLGRRDFLRKDYCKGGRKGTVAIRESDYCKKENTLTLRTAAPQRLGSKGVSIIRRKEPGWKEPGVVKWMKGWPDWTVDQRMVYLEASLSSGGAACRLRLRVGLGGRREAEPKFGSQVS